MTHLTFSEASYEYRIAYVRSLPPSSEGAKPAALELLASALGSPSIFDFDTLEKLENIKALSSHELFKLLQIFAKEGLSEYQAWVSQNGPLLEIHRELAICYVKGFIYITLRYRFGGGSASAEDEASHLRVIRI